MSEKYLVTTDEAYETLSKYLGEEIRYACMPGCCFTIDDVTLLRVTIKGFNICLMVRNTISKYFVEFEPVNDSQMIDSSPAKVGFLAGGEFICCPAKGYRIYNKPDPE